MFVIRLFAVFLALCQPLYAGGRGGYNTTFDANAYGGPANVSCLTAAIAGICNTGYGAVCNGIADDSTALDNWRIASIAANPARAVLYMAPPGSSCNFLTCAVLTTAAPGGCSGNPSSTLNAFVWEYGVTLNNIWFGGNDFYTNDEIHGALIQSASVGDTVLNLVTPAQSIRFSVGMYVYVDGISLQFGGFPPNWQFYEIHQITAVNSGAITIDSQLQHQYLSTWPQIDDFNTGGPAAIHILQPSWNVNLEVHGGTVSGPSQTNVIGRNISLYDVTFGAGGAAPSSSASVFFFGTSGPTELDKNNIFVEFFRHRFSGNLTIQSPSAATTVIDSVVLGGSLNGTAGGSTIVTNSKFGVSNPLAGIRVGPNSYGAGGTLNITGTTFPTAQSATNLNIAISALSWDNAGTLSMPNASADHAIFVPGATYYFGASDGTDDSIPHTTFHVTGITTNGTTTFYATDIPSGALPTPTCAGPPCSTFVVYSLTSVTQSFTGSSPSLSNFAVH